MSTSTASTVTESVLPVHEKVENRQNDHTGARIGMWLFLFTEVLLFGGLNLLYAVYRAKFPADFHYGAGTLDTLMGGVNTMVLLTSSLTMVLAVLFLEKRNRKYSAIFVGATIALAFVFLINRYVEWSAKFHHGLYPNSEVLQTHTPGENVFYSLYYLMTGLHAVHIIIGIVILAFIMVKVARRPMRQISLPAVGSADITVQGGDGKILWKHENGEPVEEIQVGLVYKSHQDVSDHQMILLENSGLYWHLVAVVWIFLFPLFYLIS
jgi:cytochrome c oxidase subunit III